MLPPGPPAGDGRPSSSSIGTAMRMPESPGMVVSWGPDESSGPQRIGRRQLLLTTALVSPPHACTPSRVVVKGNSMVLRYASMIGVVNSTT